MDEKSPWTSTDIRSLVGCGLVCGEGGGVVVHEIRIPLAFHYLLLLGKFQTLHKFQLNCFRFGRRAWDAAVHSWARNGTVGKGDFIFLLYL